LNVVDGCRHSEEHGIPVVQSQKLKYAAKRAFVHLEARNAKKAQNKMKLLDHTKDINNAGEGK
jgi:hypothetical protein